MKNIDMIEIIKLIKETGKASYIVERVIQEGGDISKVKTELKKRLIEEPLEKVRTLSNLSDIKKALQILGEKLNQEETSKVAEWYLEKAEWIEKGKYYWWEYVDQLLILADIGSFSQETADKTLLRCFDEGVPTTAQMLELLKRLIPMASKSVRETIDNWYFRGIAEKEMPGNWGENIKGIEINRDTMIAEENKVYDKIVFKKSCVISGSLSAAEIEAEDNLVIFGDFTVEKRAKIKGDLIVTGKLGGGGHRPSYWHDNYRNAAEYTGRLEIGGNLIANEISTYTDIETKGNIVSRHISIAEVIKAKNIFTPGNLMVFSGEVNHVGVKESVVADSILIEANNRSHIDTKIIECINTLRADDIEANEIRASKIRGWWFRPKKLEAGKITKPF